MITIKEVAAKAKVSVATISRVLNNDPAVTPKTREHVKNVIKEMDYQPNLLGRQLRKSQTKKILVMIPSISNQFYSKIISSIENTAKHTGHKVIVCMSHGDKETELAYIEMLTSKIVDGIIFLSSKLSAREMNNLARKSPIVQGCEYVSGSLTDIVTIDNEQAAYEAVKFLITNGHRKIAFLGSKEKYHSGILREDGYRRALSENGIATDEDLIIYGGYSYPDGESMALQVMEMKQRPTAIFCISDSIAIGCIKRLTACSIKIPKEIAVIGFDDTSISKMYNPSISTVSQPQVEIGEHLMKLLAKRIEGEKGDAVFKKLPHKLVLRETT